MVEQASKSGIKNEAKTKMVVPLYLTFVIPRVSWFQRRIPNFSVNQVLSSRVIPV